MRYHAGFRGLYYTLRIAAAMCFIGHGSFGLITKPIWCNYFAVFGINHDAAYRLMPVLGSFDILMGIGMLIYPIRAIPFWLVVWGLVTAALRPLSGEPFAEFIERAGNFGAPLALLILSGGIGGAPGNLLKPLCANPEPDAKTIARLTICLRTISFLLLAGHGWLNVIEKKALVMQYTVLGFPNAGKTAITIGICEIIAALSILIPSCRKFVFVILIWKTTSELFYPHYELFEWVERGGSYGVLLALWLLPDTRRSIRNLDNLHQRVLAAS